MQQHSFKWVQVEGGVDVMKIDVRGVQDASDLKKQVKTKVPRLALVDLDQLQLFTSREAQERGEAALQPWLELARITGGCTGDNPLYLLPTSQARYLQLCRTCPARHTRSDNPREYMCS